MELRHLRYFVAVAEEGNVTRAAEKLGIQQPPLSQQIKALETELGIELLKRLPRGVELTGGGKTFLRDAMSILAEVDLAAARASRFAHGIEGNIVIGFSTSAAAHAIAPKMIHAFRQTYPAVEMDLQESNAAELTEALVKRTIQVAIIRAPVAHPPGIVYHSLLKETMLVALPARHALALANKSASAAISLRSLRNEGFVLVRRPGAPGMYADLLTACRKVGFTPRIVAEVNRMLTNISLVAAGVGVTVVPASMRGFHQESVAYRRLRDAPQLVAPLTLAWREDETNPAKERFVALARELAARA